MLLFYPSVRAPLLSDNMRCFQRPVAASVPWMQFLRQFKQASRLNVMFLRGGLWAAGACAFHIQPAKRTLISNTKVASHLLSFYQSHYPGWFCTEMLILMSSRMLLIKLSNFISIHLFLPETIPKYD